MLEPDAAATLLPESPREEHTAIALRERKE
jgi:hypothetical protein